MKMMEKQVQFLLCQISYGRFYATQNGRCDVDLFVVQSDGKKILDQQRQRSLCCRLRLELLRPLCVALVNRGPDTELLVANPVEVSGKGRPLVFYDITLALKNLQKRIFLVWYYMLADVSLHTDIGAGLLYMCPTGPPCLYMYTTTHWINEPVILLKLPSHTI